MKSTFDLHYDNGNDRNDYNNDAQSNDSNSSIDDNNDNKKTKDEVLRRQKNSAVINNKCWRDEHTD